VQGLEFVVILLPSVHIAT